jgi:hypothetical protein
MENPKYSFQSASFFKTYEFISEGPKGKINKLVKYTKDEDTGLYNLAFGNKIGRSNKIDDKIISDNGDREKILATVAATVYQFTAKYPEAIIFATGSNLARTRLYRISLSNILDQINNDFEIFGFYEGNWEIFEKNRNYSAFLLTKK